MKTISRIRTLKVAVLFMSMFSMLSFSTLADDGAQYRVLGDWEVHYSAFPSTFLQPQIANTYNIRRSGNRGLINISVLDATHDDKPALRAQLSGYALNDVGQRRELQFRRFIDEPAIYYIAEIPHGNEDKFRFFITISRAGETQELRFEHTFYEQR